MHRMLFHPLLFGLLALVAGCGGESITEQELPKGQERLAPAAPAMLASAPPAPARGTGSAPALPHWQVPADWRPGDGANPFRVAAFLAGPTEAPVDIPVTVFPGDVGGMVANINRWRGQVGLAPLDDAAARASATRLAPAGYEGYWVRLDGPQGSMVAVGLHEPAMARTWFVRATGPASAVDAVTSGVLDFAGSFRPAGEAH